MRQKLEYTLFHPGLFTNYFAYPHPTTRHFSVSPWFVDFENRRAIIVGDGQHAFTTTTIEDFSSVVADSLDYEGVWPVNGGIVGSRITVAELVKMAQKLRGMRPSHPKSIYQPKKTRLIAVSARG